MSPRVSSLAHPLLRAVLDRPGEFSFFQVVALLCALHPERKAPGSRAPFAQECVRFVHDPRLDFPAGDLSAITQEVHDGVVKYRVQARFLGLSGAGTPLPVALVQELAHEEPDLATLDYLDLFHHRLYSLAFQGQQRLARLRGLGGPQGVACKEPVLEFLRPALPRDGHEFRQLEPESLIDFAPVVSQGEASVDVIEMAMAKILAHELGESGKVELVPRTGVWVQLDDEGKWLLGQQGALGSSTMLGRWAFAPSMGATLKITGLSWIEFVRHWQDDTSVCNRILELWEILVSDPIELALQVEVQRLPIASSSASWALGDNRLGETTWMIGHAVASVHHRRSLRGLEVAA